MTTETALLLTAMALCAVATLVVSYMHWKAQKPGQRDYLKKAKSLDGLLRGTAAKVVKHFRNLILKNFSHCGPGLPLASAICLAVRFRISASWTMALPSMPSCL